MNETDVARAMHSARQRMELVGIPDPARDASALFLAVAEDAVGSGDTMPPDIADAYERAIRRRLGREPVSHITGRRAFWMHDFIVTADVLDPRPDTETLVEAALQTKFTNVLDLGTGSGCILLSLLYEQTEAAGLGTDISDDALKVAAQNAAVVGVADRVTFLNSDWLASVEGTFGNGRPVARSPARAAPRPDARRRWIGRLSHHRPRRVGAPYLRRSPSGRNRRDAGR